MPQGPRPRDGLAGRFHEEEVARFRAIVEATAAAVTVLDPEWRVRWVNAAAAAMLGCDGKDAAGRPFADLLPPLAREAHLAVERPAAERDGWWMGEEVLPAPDGGRPMRVEVVTHLIEPTRAGERLGFVTIRRDVSDRHRLSAEHEAIGRVATMIAAGTERHRLFATAACEAAGMLDGAAAAVVDTHGATPGVVGRWTAGPEHDPELDAAVAATEHALAVNDDEHARCVPVAPQRCCLAAPISVEGRRWGFVLVCRPGSRFGEDEQAALERLAGIVGTGVGVLRGRDLLVRQATTDGLTGLRNHRTFHEELRAEVKRARRYSHPTAVVLMDLDEFKEVNDEHGHQTGDRLLRAVGRALQEVVRDTETVARLGGDEFAVLLPETDLDGATATAERVRLAIEAVPEAREHGVTVSAGVADLSQAASADDLIRLADGALYWSKVNGRGRVSAYDPERVEALSAQERAERLARTHALGAVRVLARLIDLKDTSTHRHSERVAELCVLLAEELGWPEERRSLLRDAALVHDVGKVVIPDHLLSKPGALTPEEYELVKEHAPTGARIAAEALGVEQVAWIAQHHERLDGTGYPAGLPAENITAGARILAFADSWDVMTSERPYKHAKPEDEALEECRELAGRQFDRDVVAAFERLRPRRPRALDVAGGGRS
jgi:diguanylate cyclase (GGDEF)-like protein/PAS domain S-box-containing protein/putative nucleotidyltransferase with HDIG domain